MSFDIKKAIGHKFEEYEVKVDNREMILYALGIGFQKDPLNAAHYNFCYENGEEFGPFPTIPVVIAHRNFGTMKIPGTPSYNPMMILHGEEKVENFSPIEVDSTIVVKEQIHDMQDKGKATVIVIQTDLYDKETGDHKARIFTNLFVRGIGGFGHKGTYRNNIPEKPKEAPQFVREEKTEKN